MQITKTTPGPHLLEDHTEDLQIECEVQWFPGLSRQMALRSKNGGRGPKGGSDSDDWDSSGDDQPNDLTEEERRFGKNRPMGVSNLTMDGLR